MPGGVCGVGGASRCAGTVVAMRGAGPNAPRSVLSTSTAARASATCPASGVRDPGSVARACLSTSLKALRHPRQIGVGPGVPDDEFREAELGAVLGMVRRTAPQEGVEGRGERVHVTGRRGVGRWKASGGAYAGVSASRVITEVPGRVWGWPPDRNR